MTREYVLGILFFVMFTIFIVNIEGIFIKDYILEFLDLKRKYKVAKSLMVWDEEKALAWEKKPTSSRELEEYIFDMCTQIGWILFTLAGGGMFNYILYLICLVYGPKYA